MNNEIFFKTINNMMKEVQDRFNDVMSLVDTKTKDHESEMQELQAEVYRLQGSYNILDKISKTITEEEVK